MRSIGQMMFTVLLGLLLFVLPALSQSASPEDANRDNSRALKLIAATPDELSAFLQITPAAEQAVVANEILAEAVRQYGKASAGEVEKIARAALRVALSAADKRCIARSWLIIGNSQSDVGDRAASYKNGFEAAKEASADDLAVKLAISISQLQAGTKAEEIEWLRAGLPHAERSPDKKVLSSLLGRIGNAYAQNGEYDAAREYHARSLDIKKAMNDVFGIATTASNLGIIYGMQGDLVPAREHFEQSLAILDTLSEKDAPDLVQRKAKDLRNLGIVADDPSRALDYYLRSLKLSEDAKYKNGIYGTSFQIASLYNSQGEYELARQFLRRGEGVSDDSQLPAEMMGVLGDSYMGEGKYDKAIEAYLKQNEDVMKHEGGDNVIDSLMHLGTFYLIMQDLEQADVYFNRALQIARESKNDLKISRALEGLSRSRLAAKDPKGAIDLAEQAKTYQAKLTGVHESWELYTTIGSANAGLGKPEVARANFEKAVTLVEDLRKKTLGSPTKQPWLPDRAVIPFNRMIESLIAAKDVGQAFSFAERAKAHTLLDILTHGKVNVTGVMTPEEKSAEQRFKNELASLTAQGENEKDAKMQVPGRLSLLERQLSEKRLDFEHFKDRLYAVHPQLRVQRGEMSPVSTDEVAALLPETRSAVVEFVVAEDKTFLFVAAKNPAQKVALSAFTIDIKREDVVSKIEAYRAKLAAGDLDFQKNARELYELFLQPAAAQLAGRTSIIIVPDGPLWNMPFQALSDEKGTFLAEKAAVSYAPSVTALREMRRKAKQQGRSAQAELLAFGNPTVGKQTLERVKRVFMGEKLEPIPEAERLVNELSKMYGPRRSKVFTGAAAREETAKSESPKYRIVQFATHGILNNVSPMYSHLVLAQNDNDPSEDGLLEAWEMKDLDLKADMVILSACDTARGHISSGEGVIGMTWASFIAGAPTTVASQWKVESSSTTELMLEFHRQLLTGRVSKAEALRRAEIKLLHDPRYAHPSYWGGWVLVGNGN